jgi:hypothetical protein
MAHNRKLVLGGVALTEARNNRHCVSVAAEVMDELEPIMVSTGYLDKAPFRWVGLMLRFGLRNDEQPSYQRIGEKEGDLPVAIELDTHELQRASRQELKDIFKTATLRVLVHVAQKYGLAGDRFVEMLGERQATDVRE